MKRFPLVALSLLALISCSRLISPTPVLIHSFTASPASTEIVTQTTAPRPSTTISITQTEQVPPTAETTIVQTPVYGPMISPDGSRKVQSLDWNKYEILTLDGKVLWSIVYDNKFDSPEPGWYPFFWSLDGRNLYFTCYHGPDDGSTKFYGQDQMNGDCVYRLDIETGVLVEIVPDIHPGYYAFAISPDGRQLVYANQTETPVKIVLLDLVTMEEKVLVTADNVILEMGNFGWSPDMEKITYVSMTMKNDGETRIYSICLIDLRSLQNQIIAENIEHYLHFDRWEANGTQYYHDTYRAVWMLNLLSGVLTPLAVPTVTLAP